MRFCLRKILVLCWMINTGSVVFGQEALTINNKIEREEAFGGQISLFEDLTGTITFDSILKHNFVATNVIIANNRDSKTAYWVKFNLLAEENIIQNQVFEILDFKIDSFELYLPMPDGSYKVYKGGDAYPFSERNYIHKNFLYDLPSYPKGLYTGYIRIKVSEVVGLNFAISEIKSFLKYSNNEYLLLASFYGIIVAMALFSLLLYTYLYEKSYLFYALYILSLGLYFLTRDGLGFQYLWSDIPAFNNYCKPLTVLLVVIFHVFFVRFYLNAKQYFKYFDKIIYGLLIVFPLIAFLADTIAEILPDPLIAASLLFIPLFIFSIKLALRGDIQARFFVVAYTIQFLGFLVFILAYFDLIQKGIFIFYSINIASAAEIIVFSLAVAGKVKQLIKDKEELKDSANRILEEKVKERTLELQERNKQLDVFVYKASHDIKGPLKSMIGLSTIALTDVHDFKAKEYFEYLLTTSTKLDKMVSELLRMGKVKDLEVNYADVNLHKVISEIINTLQHLPGFSKMNIEINISEDHIVRTDETLIYSVLQNIIENSIKYMDPAKTAPFLKINMDIQESVFSLSFEDNGLGIPENGRERIFDMFYKVNNSSNGTGLGLYLTRITVEKLGGKINLFSEEGKGTTFFLYFNT
jgi:signal transduction histidine kinase